MASDLTDDQILTYTSLLDLGFSSEQSKHAALRFGSKAEEAANWLFENPDSTASNDYRPSTPNAVPQRHDHEEDLPHPSTIGQFPKGVQLHSSELPPPPPPAYDTVYGPESYTEHDKSDKGIVQLTPSSLKPTADIDLTLDDDSSSTMTTAAPSAGARTRAQAGIEATDLQRAIEASTTHLNQRGPPAHERARNDDEDDTDMDKALALSMASLGSQDHDESFRESYRSQMDDINPEDRVRDSLKTPVMVRSSSPLMSALSSYLESLYAVPTWRNTIFAWNAALDDFDDPTRVRDLEGVWKGESNLDDESSTSLGPASEAEARIQRLTAVQRLFALMKESRRSFVHCQEVVKAFKLNENQFHGIAGISTIKDIHAQLIQDLEESTITTATTLNGDRGGLSPSKLSRSFTVRGRKVAVDAHLGAPLPPVASDAVFDGSDDSARRDGGAISTHFLDLWINPAAEDEQSFFERLDSILLRDRPVVVVGGGQGPGQSATTRSDGDRDEGSTTATATATALTGEYDLLTDANPPCSTLAFGFHRHTELTSLDHFGASGKTPAAAANSTSVGGGGGGGGRTVFGIEQEIWLDRYYVKRRREIRDARAEWYELKRTLTEVKARYAKLARTKDGADAVEVVRGVVEYLENATSAISEDEPEAEGECGGDEARRQRQERLRANYRAILDEMETKLRHYQSQLDSVSSSIANQYSSPAWRTLGPYHLASVVVRTGLNGRGTSYSLARGDDGQWWKLVDLERQRLSPEALDHALTKDTIGLFLDAGTTFAFYQLEGAEEVEHGVPDHLASLVAKDNLAFAQTLPNADDLVERWHLADVRVAAVDLSRPRGLAHDADDDSSSGTVQDIQLSPLRPDRDADDGVIETPRTLERGRGPTRMDEDDDELEPLIPDPAATSQEVEMSSATSPSADSSSEEEVAMRLRGGANDGDEAEDEDEDEYDDDDEEEFDEDEVELGLLEPMPQEWDVDYAVGKVGGVPVWLDPTSPLSADRVACEICQKTMSLLLQVNSPDDSRPHAAARSLYVFACRTKSCLAKDASRSIRVWRTQMNSPNDFFPHTEASLKKREELEAALAPTSGLCGGTTKTQPWPEWNIQAEPEPYEESYLPDDRANSANDASGIEGEDADAPDTVSGVDKEFLVFQERIEREPNQVLRFYRLPDVEAPEPLWTSSKKIDPLVDVAPCPLCRGPREVEFQILSTLLSHLGDDNLEFDSLLVYTCLDNCEIPSPPPPTTTTTDGGNNGHDTNENGTRQTGWAQEIVFKQDFSSSGVRFGVA